ncbi:gliding motility-associated C-terminal domain-containing protein [Flavobacterium agricola]|uniref:Gliding motility-associated C-terminal domain-containing protein n=1 Tax=Flavobacterium agricola TaxID=2870839 RepID=A0ABY6M3L5_9FLAO|nr:gliding motility-associated C-terminal domain-containing protein [Flavobacterium agricola]UYW02008.1 gliding motility-associated C-terminal domain-containing protein [Flavobacterium agricola]
MLVSPTKPSFVFSDNYFFADAISSSSKNISQASYLFHTFNYAILPQTVNACGSLLIVDFLQQNNIELDAIESLEVYDSTNQLVTNSSITESGVYRFEITSNLGASESSLVAVTITPAPVLSIVNEQVFLQVGQTHQIQATTTNGSIITYIDVAKNQPVQANVGPFTTAGTYIYKVVATQNECETVKFVTIDVKDVAACKQNNVREYATIAKPGRTLLGSVTNAANAANANTETYATITLPISLLGLTTAYLDLEFTNPVPAGKPIVLKLGTGYGALDLLSGATLTTIVESQSGGRVTSGLPQSIQANLLGLLNGKNEYEVVFNPNPSNPNQKIYGVRILITATLSVAQNLNVYNAYYNSDALNTNCESEVMDVLSGTKGYGVNVANATVGVNNPRNFMLDDANAFTQMFVNVGVLAESYLTPVYSTYSQKEDVIEMVVSDPNGLLNVSLLSALTYRKFDHQTPVGPINSLNANLLSLTLLFGSTDKFVLRIQDSNTLGPWDRFELRLGAVANVLEAINIYSIKRQPQINFVNNPAATNFTFCVGEEIVVENQECTSFKWYESATGNDLLSSANSFTIPASFSGNKTIYIQAVRNGCEVLERYPVEITVKPSLVSTNISATATLDVANKCSGNVALTATVASSVTLTNPQYQWFKLVNGEQILVEDESNNVLNVSGLLPGAYSYFVGIGSDEYCFTPESERVQVDFVVPRNTTTADFTSNHTVDVCNDLTVSITPDAALTNVTYEWYLDAAGVTKITNVTLNGVTYQVTANQLLVTGLPIVNAPLTYYVALASDQTCADLTNLLPVVVNYEPQPNLAVLVPGDQIFCQASQATLADIRLNATDIVWYDALTNGTVLPASTILTDGATYYAIRTTTESCANVSRLAVTVRLDDVPAPTLPANQMFCEVNQPKVKDLEANNYLVVWKDENGVVLNENDLLVHGKQYFAYNAPVANCESATATAVTVTITTGQTTAVKNNLAVCDSTANLQSLLAVYNGVWYADAGKTTILNPTDVLVAGQTYYATDLDSTTCESTAYEITIQIVPDAIAITASQGTTDFCINQEYTFQATPGFNTYNWQFGTATVVNGGGINDSFITVKWSTTGAHSVTVSVDDLACLPTNEYVFNLTTVPDAVTITNSEGTTNFCINQGYTFQATPGFSLYNWQVGNATVVAGGSVNDSFITVKWNAPGLNTLAVTVNNLACLTSNQHEVVVTTSDCSVILDPDLGLQISSSHATPYFLDDVLFTIKIVNMGEVDFTDVVVAFELSSGFEFKSFQTQTGTYNRRSWTIPELKVGQEAILYVTAKVLEFGSHGQEVSLVSSVPVDLHTENNSAFLQLQPVKNDCLLVYNEISPNGDGQNDYFVVSCIERYPHTQLHIYNRYGNVVYKNANYNNTFNGHANVSRTFAGNELPSGTYFYTLDFADGTTEKKSGWLYIMR